MNDWIYDYEELNQLEHTVTRSEVRSRKTPLDRPKPILGQSQTIYGSSRSESENEDKNESEDKSEMR